jgi:hypothetical protein
MRSNSRIIATLAFAVALAPAARALSQCGPGTVAGSYAYNFSGFISLSATQVLPASAAGRITFDGRGQVSGTQTRSVAGSALDETYSGTYTVNPDCTGSFTVNVQPDTRVSTVKVEWANNTNDVYFVFTNPGFTLTGTGKRVSPRD